MVESSFFDNMTSQPPLDRGNGNDRRQRRKQEVAVGAAASKTRVLIEARSGCWEPQPGLVERMRD
ncbi:hypothetical protein FP2_01250 [Faecalibacterium prausnitzii L2-6]|uniref:Uncharacterized protein n=1 Tax=Faecalibacterium prausnitzii L2-6 TaxID=718252 RepID=D4K2T5_9FIRM|nr:hypothetical protein FP2_01250 [Faecalibacterium prausnitzii L2-6]